MSSIKELKSLSQTSFSDLIVNLTESSYSELVEVLDKFADSSGNERFVNNFINLQLHTL